MTILRVRRSMLVLLVLLAVCGGPMWRAVAAATLNHAGVVVRHGDGRMAYAYVSFDEEEISGVELLKRTGLDVVTVSFGGLGEGVCSIDEHGCPSTDCRKRVCQGPKPDDPFWQYFRQAAVGEWTAVALGASSTNVRDGDVDGWSWTGTTPGLPPLTIADVARLAGFQNEAVDIKSSPIAGAVVRREGAMPPAEPQGPGIYVAAGGLFVLAGVFIALVVRLRRGQTGIP